MTWARAMRGQAMSVATSLMIVGVLSIALSGCTAVKPWERDVMARDDMAFDSDPMRATLQNHIRFSKEGSLPVGGGGGGGCGCN